MSTAQSLVGELRGFPSTPPMYVSIRGPPPHCFYFYGLVIYLNIWYSLSLLFAFLFQNSLSYTWTFVFPFLLQNLKVLLTLSNDEEE